ncbi:MAG: hypothetical protein KF845_08670 [Cyclobacteriaceae bacterium]|nr:hypothetical protein [Cyclobacteriaceae bacterium]
MGTVFVNLGRLEGKPTTFKFPYSRSRVYLEPEFIPKDKRKAELIIGMYFCQIQLINLSKNIDGVRLNDDDSNKQGDIIYYDNGELKYVQLTRLTFTDFETRKSMVKHKSIDFAKRIGEKIKLDYPLIITIFPKNKHKVPLKNFKRKGRIEIEERLIEMIFKSITNNSEKLKNGATHIEINIGDELLKKYYYSLDLVPVPKGFYPNVWGSDNIFINYNFYGSTYDNIDADKAINELFLKKNLGHSDTLLIWANSFELHNLKGIVEKLIEKFSNSTFKFVYLMTFNDNVALFRETLNLWTIKTSQN